jgi:predicted transcriptional regulator
MQITFICVRCATVYSVVNWLALVMKLENQEGIEKLYFELASESRFAILRELNRKNGKMKEIAGQLNLTTTETFRQLQRLNEALFVQKQPDGGYTITEYGRFVLQLSTSFEFIYKHRQYFSTHDFRRLPYQFQNRIGELSSASLGTDTMENINLAERITREADQYMWGGGVEQSLNISSILMESIPKGVKYKFLFPQRFINPRPLPSQMAGAIEWRSFEDLPVNIVLTEKEAGISFCLVGGKADYVGFAGKDPVFLGWVKDLFCYYWEKGKRV